MSSQFSRSRMMLTILQVDLQAILQSIWFVSGTGNYVLILLVRLFYIRFLSSLNVLYHLLLEALTMYVIYIRHILISEQVKQDGILYIYFPYQFIYSISQR